MHIDVPVIRIADFTRDLGEYSRLQIKTNSRNEKVLDSIRGFHHLAAFELPLPRTADGIELIVEEVKQGIDILKLDKWCKELREVLEKDLETYTFLAVQREAGKYLSPDWLSKSALAKRSPEALRQLRSAAQCLAKDEPTACVLHCLRIFEYGLHVAAKALGVGAHDLRSVAHSIQGRMSEKYKGADWLEAEPFYADLLGDIKAFAKRRNPAMHGISESYDPEEAEYRKAFSPITTTRSSRCVTLARRLDRIK